jgi:hypothetical protein
MDTFMLIILMCFVLVGLAICSSIALYIFTSAYWQQHGFIRKIVRFSAALSHFFVFTIASCIVKRKLYYRDEGRFSHKFLRRLWSFVCPTTQNHPMQSFLTKSEGQNLSQDQLRLQSNKNWCAQLKYAVQRSWPYAVVIVLFMGECCVFFVIIRA